MARRVKRYKYGKRTKAFARKWGISFAEASRTLKRMGRKRS